MTRRTLTTVFLFLLVGSLCAFMPMRLVMPTALLNVEDVQGTIWSANARRASVGMVPLGDLTLGLRWPAHLHVQTEAGLSGEIDPLFDGLSISNANGGIALSSMSVFAQSADLHDASLRFGKQGCLAASGRVRVTLAAIIGGVPMGQTLSGSMKCEANDLRLKLTSQTGLESAEFKLSPGNAYEMAILVKPLSSESASKLKLAGFAETPLGYQFNERGNL